MRRWVCALTVLSGISLLSGCKSGPLASVSAETTSLLAANESTQLDPRLDMIRSKGQLSEEYKKAKETLKRPNRVMLANARFKEDMGVSQRNAIALEEARQIYTNMLTDNPNSVEAVLGLARIDTHADRLVDAERMFKSALTLFPGDNNVLAETASFYTKTDRPSEAIRLLQPAIQKSPEHRALRETMATALVQADQPEAAVPHFEKAVGRASAFYNVGLLLMKRNQDRAAQGYLNQALDRDPAMDEARMALTEIAKRASGGARENPDRAVRHAAGRVTESFDIQQLSGFEPPQ